MDSVAAENGWLMPRVSREENPAQRDGIVSKGIETANDSLFTQK